MNFSKGRGLDKLGDAYLPGSDRLPSFSALGCGKHLPLLLETMEPGDRNSIRRLFALCDGLPAPVIRFAVGFIARCGWLPDALGGRGLRLFHTGTKGLVMTLYYSGHRGNDCPQRDPLTVLDCQLATYTDDLETTRS